MLTLFTGNYFPAFVTFSDIINAGRPTSRGSFRYVPLPYFLKGSVPCAGAQLCRPLKNCAMCHNMRWHNTQRFRLQWHRKACRAAACDADTCLGYITVFPQQPMWMDESSCLNLKLFVLESERLLKEPINTW